MDVVKSKASSSKFSKKQKLIAGTLSLLIILVIATQQTLNTVSLNRSELIIAEVKQGDLDVTIEGYGILKSNKLQLITALSRSTVKQILLKPGATVTKDSVIVRLENPELIQQVDNVKQEIAQLDANLRQLKVNHKREVLQENADVAEIQARYETAKLERQAREKLVKDGIVSNISYQESLLLETQLKHKIEILNKKAKQLKLVHEEAINIQLERIKQQQGRLNIAQERLDKLTVKAGFDGVLQTLSVELGQSLTAGQEIALIGSVTDLVALIKVPQAQAQQIIVGHQAIIDTRRDKINGKVIRIDPIVENNTVNIEIALPDDLPASARPQLNVDGVIITDRLANVSYIERPANVKSNTEVALYQISDNYDSAERKFVKFGRQAGRYIEITSGASTKQKFIISDLSSLKLTEEHLSIES